MRYAYNLLAMITAFSLPGTVWRVFAYDLGLSQEPADAPLQIAAPFPNETAFQMVGRTNHSESSITSYGYLSSVAGFERSMVFAEPGSASAATARFTYFARMDRSEIAGSGGIPVINTEGTLTVYFNENGGANLDASESFFQGTPIATTQVRLQEVFQLEQPSSIVIIGEGTLTQVFDSPFQYEGVDYRFGHVDLEERLLYVGTTVREAPTPTALVASIAGHATVSPSDARDEPVTGIPTAETLPEATESAGQASTADTACEGVESWLAEATANVEQAEAIIAGIPVSAALESLDPAEVTNAAADLGALVESQRAAAVPEIGTSTNGLLVTALSTYIGGTTLVERAIAEQDEALLTQALDIIQDGNELIARALDQMADVATRCGVEL